MTRGDAPSRGCAPGAGAWLRVRQVAQPAVARRGWPGWRWRPAPSAASSAPPMCSRRGPWAASPACGAHEGQRIFFGAQVADHADVETCAPLVRGRPAAAPAPTGRSRWPWRAAPAPGAARPACCSSTRRVRQPSEAGPAHRMAMSRYRSVPVNTSTSGRLRPGVGERCQRGRRAARVQGDQQAGWPAVRRAIPACRQRHPVAGAQEVRPAAGGLPVAVVGLCAEAGLTMSNDAAYATRSLAKVATIR